MEPSEEPRTSRAFHSDDLSQFTFDALALMTQEGDEIAGCELWRRSDNVARGIAVARGLHDEADWRDDFTDVFRACLRNFRASSGRFRPYFTKSFNRALGDALAKRAKRGAGRVGLEDVDESFCYELWVRDTHDPRHQTAAVVAEAIGATIVELERQPTSSEQSNHAPIARLYLVACLSPAEIAQRLGMKRKDVYNAVSRVVKPTMRRHIDRINNDGADGAGNRP